MQDLIHEQKFTIRGYDVGVTMQADALSIIRILHDSAVDQVVALGFSALQLAPRNLAWVLTQQYMEIFRPPTLGDQVKVITFPSGTDRIFTYRDYQMYDLQGTLLAQATTTWILMDLVSRKISSFPPDIEQILSGANKLEHLPRAPQCRNEVQEPGYTKSYVASYFELDFNGHISNHYFFKWMLDPIPIEFLSSRELVDFNVKLKGEAFAGDEITSVISPVNNQKIEHMLYKEQKIIASGISHWRIRM